MPLFSRKHKSPQLIKEPLGLNFLIVFILLAALIFFFTHIINFKGEASLAITSLSGPVKIEINNQQQEATASFSQNLDPGEKIFKLTKDQEFYQPFERRITLTEGNETSVNWDLGPNEVFSSGVIVEFKKDSQGVSIVSTPDEAEITIDSQAQGATPFITADINQGSHQLKVSRQGYLEHESTFSVKKGFATQITVQLFPILLPEKPAKIREEGISGFPKVNLSARHDWKADEALADQSQNQYLPIKKIVLYDLSLTEAPYGVETTEWVKGIYYYTLVYEAYSDLPYHYLIDSQGKIFEGKKGGCESFPAEKEDGLEKACRVGYLGKAGEKITQAAQMSFEKLISSTQPLFYQAEVAPPSEIGLNPQETKTLQLEFKNTGTAIWFGREDSTVALRAINGTSAYYDAASWQSAEQISVISEPWVLPDSKVTLDVTLKAPLLPDSSQEQFGLFTKDNDSWSKIGGSEVTLKVKVKGEVAIPTIRVRETGTGFLNVRSGPGLMFGVVDQVYPGDTLPLLEEQVGWVKIRYQQNREGWVSATYVEKL